jgi:mannose-6-phosphate isomerase-like protein (cupin superfamily)
MEREWGYYTVLYDVPGNKVKELVVRPGKSLSMQKHKMRNEYWHVVEGTGNVLIETRSSSNNVFLGKQHHVTIPKFSWHKLTNTGDIDLRIIEIQYGEECIEEDIERK